MNIIQRYITQNRSHTTLIPQGIVIHETATPNASADAEFNYFNSHYVSASAHAFIDFDKIVETVPSNEIAWGSGRTSNSKFLQFELCHYDDERFTQVWNNAVEYVASKIKSGIPNLIYSHADISNMYKETDHQDPISYFAQFNKTMEDFKKEVALKLMGEKIKYSAHVQNVGWQDSIESGTAGTVGQSLRMEALTVAYSGPETFTMEGHVQDVGWQALRGNGEVIGTMGRELRLEAVKLHLKGIQYRAHVEGIGWQDWVNDGEIAGTVGQSLRLEAIEIRREII